MNVNISKAKKLPLEFYELILNFINEQEKDKVNPGLMKPYAVYEPFLKLSIILLFIYVSWLVL